MKVHATFTSVHVIRPKMPSGNCSYDILKFFKNGYNILVNKLYGCLLVGFNVVGNIFSVISRRCLVATGSSMLTLIVLSH